jgi:hypothetical protein
MQFIDSERASYKNEHDGQKHEDEEECHAAVHSTGPLAAAGIEVVGKERHEDDESDDLEDETSEGDVDADLDSITGPGNAG